MQKIIIIEDSSLLRMRISKVLQQNGNYFVKDYKSADDIARNPHLFLSDAALIITDVWLPGISGIELARSLSTLPRFCKIPVIFMSANNDSKIIHEAIRAGAADYIAKPFEDHLLIDKVKKVLGEPLLSDYTDYICDAERLKEIVSMEFERASRGHQQLSFIKLSISKMDTANGIMHLKNILRKIDMIYIMDPNIIAILPLTDEKGTSVVWDKISTQLTAHEIEILSNHLITYTPGSSQTMIELFKSIL